MDILVIAVCAVISGAEDGRHGRVRKANAEWLGDLLDLPHGIPGIYLSAVLSRLAPRS